MLFCERETILYQINVNSCSRKCIRYSKDVSRIYITAVEQSSIITAIAALIVDNPSIIFICNSRDVISCHRMIKKHPPKVVYWGKNVRIFKIFFFMT